MAYAPTPTPYAPTPTVLYILPDPLHLFSRHRFSSAADLKGPAAPRPPPPCLAWSCRPSQTAPALSRPRQRAARKPHQTHRPPPPPPPPGPVCHSSPAATRSTVTTRRWCGRGTTPAAPPPPTAPTAHKSPPTPLLPPPPPYSHNTALWFQASPRFDSRASSPRAARCNIPPHLPTPSHPRSRFKNVSMSAARAHASAFT
jgi:hypothetical protein